MLESLRPLNKTGHPAGGAIGKFVVEPAAHNTASQSREFQLFITTATCAASWITNG